jgi:hypothetical protein
MRLLDRRIEKLDRIILKEKGLQENTLEFQGKIVELLWDLQKQRYAPTTCKLTMQSS